MNPTSLPSCACQQGSPEYPDAWTTFDARAVARIQEELGEEIDGVIEVFLRLLPERIQTLDQAIASNDAKNLRIIAHTLKGSSCQLGAMQLGCLALKLETMGHENALAQAPECFAQLVTAAKEVQQTMRAVFNLPPL